MNRIEADKGYLTINVTSDESYIRKPLDETTTMHELTFASVKAAREAMDMIADALIRYDMAIGEKESSDAGTDEQTRQQIHAIFRDKYELLEGADRASE